MTTVAEPHDNSADGPQNDHVTTSPNPDEKVKGPNSTSNTENSTTCQEEELMVKDDNVPKGVLAKSGETPVPVAVQSQGSTVVEGPENPSTQQKDLKSDQTSISIASALPQSEAAANDKTAVSVVEASTMCQCQGELEIGTVTAPKRPRTPTPPASPNSTPIDIEQLQREYVFINIIRSLKKSFHYTLEACGMLLGSKEALRIRYEPDIERIRHEAMCPPGTTLQFIANSVVLEMLNGWKECCRHIISQYRKEMRRDLFLEAFNKARVIKEKILEDAMDVRATPPHFAPVVYSPSPPPPPSHLPSPPLTPTRLRPSSRPQTPTTGGRSTPPSVDSIRPGIKNLRLIDGSLKRDDETDNDSVSKSCRSSPKAPLRRTPMSTNKRRRVAEAHQTILNIPITPRARVQRWRRDYGPSPGSSARKAGRRTPASPSASQRPSPSRGGKVVGRIRTYAVVKSPAGSATKRERGDDVFGAAK